MENDVLILLVVPLTLLFLGFITTHGFENLISQPVIERFLKSLKPYQPYLVTAIGIVLTFVSKRVGVELVPNLAPYLNASGDFGTIVAGILVSVLAMAFKTKPPQVPPAVG